MQKTPQPPSTQVKPKLPFYERLAACLIICFIVFLVVLNIYLDEGKIPDTKTPIRQVNNLLVQVTIEGAVKHPGVYQVSKGSTVLEALQLAEPLEEANFKRIKLDSKIMRRRTIKVQK